MWWCERRIVAPVVEEPVADPMADLAAFHCTTGVPVALDESVDEALLQRGGGGSVYRAGPFWSSILH